MTWILCDDSFVCFRHLTGCYLTFFIQMLWLKCLLQCQRKNSDNMADNIVKSGLAISLMLIGLLGCYFILPTAPQERSNSVSLVYSEAHKIGINASG